MYGWRKRRVWTSCCIIGRMPIDGLPFADALRVLRPESARNSRLLRFIRFLEGRLGARFMYERSRIPFGRDDLLDLFELAERMRTAGIITSYGPVNDFPDEPPFKQWRARCGTAKEHVAGGLSIEDDRNALLPALAEALERYLWFEANDYFVAPRVATAAQVTRVGAAILPGRFAGFSDAQRITHQRLTLAPEALYTWIPGHSWTNRGSVLIPAQVVSGLHGGQVARRHIQEPLIIAPITTGLATGPTREFALLGGALEIIERDAFMITWMNQLSPPRLACSSLAERAPSLVRLFELCDRYRLSCEIVLLPTDVPTYAVCAVVRDEAGGPQVSIGLRANQSLTKAAEGALLEALRIRHTIRYRHGRTKSRPDAAPEHLNHLERADFWAWGGRAEQMAFLTAGPAIPPPHETWEGESLERHLNRIVNWAREKQYEFASVNIGASRKNVSPWHVHMVVMPEMQPIHQNERLIYLGGKRLAEVPRQFGYTPRQEPFCDAPHPFA